MEFADSKQLTEDQRDKLFEKINQIESKLGWAVNILSPNLISNSMLKRSKYNLNELSHDTAIGLIKRVSQTKIVIDSERFPIIILTKFKSYKPQLRFG